MEKVYENMSKYGEEMKGKFSHNLPRNGIVILVTSPFVEEIHIECDHDISNEYWNTYSLLAPQAEHPEGENRKIYYNTREKYYYRSEWREKNPEQQESKSGYIWVEANSEDIVEHARQCEKLQAHYRSYHDIHKGQLCVFRGYAVDPNGDFKKPSTVESMFDRHKWFYNPWSFKVSLLDENTIDGLVKEILPSRECLEESLERHDAADDELKRQEWKRKWERIKSTPERLQKWLTKYNQIFLLLTSSLVAAIVTLIATLLITRNQ